MLINYLNLFWSPIKIQYLLININVYIYSFNRILLFFLAIFSLHLKGLLWTKIKRFAMYGGCKRSVSLCGKTTTVTWIGGDSVLCFRLMCCYKFYNQEICANRTHQICCWRHVHSNISAVPLIMSAMTDELWHLCWNSGVTAHDYIKENRRKQWCKHCFPQ